MAHAAARGAIGFGAARFVLGLSEACNFPLAIRTVAEWFPKKERALATGIFNSGTTVGAIAAPLAVPWIAVTWGWQWAFLILGAVSAVWIVPWLGMYRRPEDHPRVTAAELAFIRGDAPESVARVPWAQLLPLRQTWAFTLGKFLTDPIWWFLLYWLPKFLNTRYGLTLTDLGPPLAAIYAMSMAGSVLGGDGFRRG